MSKEKDKQDAVAHNEEGRRLFCAGQYQEALVVFGMAIACGSERGPAILATAYANRGSCWLRLQGYDQAFQEYDTAVQLLVELLEGEGQQQGQDGDVSATHNGMVTVLYHAYVGRGLAQSAQRQDDAAVADLTAAIRLDPQAPYAHFHLGVLELERGCPELALADLNQAVLLAPTDARAYYYRGVVHQRLGNRQAAAQDRLTAMQLGFAPGVDQGAN